METTFPYLRYPVMCIDTIAPLQPCISMATPPHASALVRLTFDSWSSGPFDCIHSYVVKIYFIFTRPTFLYVSYLQVSNPRLRQWSPSELRPACSKRQPTRLRRDPRPRQWRCITVHTLAGVATTAICRDLTSASNRSCSVASPTLVPPVQGRL